MSLPRSKMHTVVQSALCADCGTDDPQWASLNRGVLICSECCSVHRSLGRHVSQVRSLKKGTWHSAQLALMYTLYNNGSNNIWEHSLLDPQSSAKIRRKPTPRDPVNPTKADFIRAKYGNLSFALKPNKDDGPLNLADLNRQLWSCVRTSHVETTLRLLALGADPNYADPEKGTTPLHVAAKEGQALQVELLCIYGGDPGQPDMGDQTPTEVAKLENHPELALRLDELRFEVTNRLTMFLCGRKPDHSRGQHFLIPELAGEGGNDKAAKLARKKLQLLLPLAFEKLVQDVHDEVDRREMDAAWMACMQGMEAAHHANERYIVPFLPVNQELSATRNQSRQKLAKFNAREFATLIIDVLNEAKRRFSGQPQIDTNGPDPDTNGPIAESSAAKLNGAARPSTKSDDGRDYDDVADSPRKSGDSPRRSLGNKTTDTTTSDTNESGAQLDNVTLDDYLELKDKLNDSESKVDEVVRSNGEILRQLRQLQSTVDRLMDENLQLRMDMRSMTVRSPRPSPTPPVLSSSAINNNNGHSGALLPPKSLPLAVAHEAADSAARGVRRQASLSSPSAGLHHNPPHFETVRNGSAPPVDWQRRRNITSYPDNLIVETEQLTIAIKSLLADAQDGRLGVYASGHAVTIRAIIDRLVGLVPVDFRSGPIEHCLNAMVDACMALSVRCNSQGEVQAEETCQAAYNVAKSAKNLLTVIQQ
uniref:Arf-GAP domain-containing protein n=1 Tax=Plectus sambesii TaxID=2011161 RepID=A0A914XK64_9BILA